MQVDCAKAGAAASPARPEDEERALLEVVAALLAEVGDGRGLGLLGPDASLERDLGLGSLERVELACRIEAAFGVRLPEEAVAAADTPRALLELARKKRGAAPRASAPFSFAPSPPQREEVACSPPPERARTLVELLEYRATRDPDRVHILLVREDGSEEPITHADLRREAGAIAASLRALGLRPGGKVALMLPTSRGYFASFMGALLAGGVPVPIYPPFRLDRIAEYVARQSKILENAEAEILVTFERAARLGGIARDRVPSLRHVIPFERLLAENAAGGAIAAAAGPLDTALIQYTSGSTGDPKGVELTHENVLANVRAIREAADLRPDDLVVSWLPLYHDMGLIAGWLLDLYAGSRTVVMSPLRFLARPETWLETIARHRATRSVAPNFAFDLCARRIPQEAAARLDLRSLRTVLNGSEPVLPASIERFFDRFGPAGFRPEAMFPAYGLAENMVAVAFPPLDRAPRIDAIERGPFEREGRAIPAQGGAESLRFVSVGRPIPGVEVRLVDDAGNEVGERRVGRLHFRGPSAFKGYYRNPEATARVKLAGGWVDTGDLAYRAEGELFIAGRVKDVIIKGGRNYYPHEIEAVAGTVPDVRQGCVAAFGLRDEVRGTESIVVVAETRIADPARREALSRAVGEAVAGAVGIPPDRVVLVPPGAVPKTSSGKLRRNEARRLFLAGELGRARAGTARQALGLFIAGLPARLRARARGAAEWAYGLYGTLVLLSIFGLGVALASFLSAGRATRRATAALAKLSLALTGLWPRVLGAANLPRGAAVVVANHASYLDPYWLLAALPDSCRYAVKGECRNVPVFGRLFFRAGHVLIDRQGGERSLAGLRELSDLLARGEKIVLFAEGTFTREVGLRPFKLGAFRLSCERGVPLVPVVLRGTRRAFPDGARLLRPARVEVEILPPILPEGAAIGDMIRLRDRAAEAIAARLDEPRLALPRAG